MKIAVSDCLSLLHACANAALASHALSLPGYPFVTSVPLALGPDHAPWLLMSDLAEHCRNVRADGRVSLLLQRADGADVLAAERMTLLGDLQPAQPDADTLARLLRYCPDFADYLALGDFHFFRLQPRRVRFIGGFGRMGWVEEGDWQAAALLPAAREAELLTALQPLSSLVLLGIDRYGLDCRQGDSRLRLDFAAVASVDDVGAVARARLQAEGLAT
ncbi:HugZ family protein [Vogesella sp. GCM10023246]|uniref:Pyridoxamine 5'-phosphate oxidase n=1 Tax=Vogesella oryzagri TaxID=3160864 RepID=A0ABV1LZI6_9NEIS